MKKLFALLCAGVLALGCVNILASPSAPSPAPAVGDGVGSVYYLNFKPEQSAQWSALASAYTNATGVPVTVVTAASGTYEEALRSELAKADPPTLFQVNGPRALDTWRAYCMDLRGTALDQYLADERFGLWRGDELLAVAYVIESYGIIYNRTLLKGYCTLDGAVISAPEQITDFQTLRAVAQDIQARREELGVLGAFTSAGMDSSSDWRFKTHLVNLPLYYSLQSGDGMFPAYLENLRQIWDLYISNATCAPAMIGAKTGEDAASEFALGEAVFYQNGTWAYHDLIAHGLTDEDLGMLPIYIGIDGEENQGLCTGSENYWCINRQASPEDIEATKAFVEWLITSDEGRYALSAEMGFVTPFTTFGDEYAPHNALQAAVQDDLVSGRTPVDWAFTALPGDVWKDNVGSALLEYAQGTGGWEQVEAACLAPLR